MKAEIIELIKADVMIFLYIAPFLFVAAILLVNWGRATLRREREQEADYNRLYNEIESLLDGNIDLTGMRQDIRDKVDKLLSLPHKNREKSMVLYLKYLERFGGVGKRPA